MKGRFIDFALLSDEFRDEATEIANKEQSKSTSSGKPPPSKVSKTDKSHDVKKKAAKEQSSEAKVGSSATKKVRY